MRLLVFLVVICSVGLLHAVNNAHGKKPFEYVDDDDELSRYLDSMWYRNGTRRQLPTFNCGLHKGNTLRYRKRISGGRDVKVGEFPSHVALLNVHEDDSVSGCGGVIVDSDLILTAAHCIDEPTNPIKEQWVSTGITLSLDMVDQPFKGKKYRVKHSCKSWKFARQGPKFDLGVLILEQHIEFNDEAQPACLPNEEMPESEEGFFLGVGFDLISDIELRFPLALQVLPVSRSKCHKIDTHEGVTCFSESKKSRKKGASCRGDSGSPIIWEKNGRHYVMAILSSSSKELYGRCDSLQYPYLIAADFHNQLAHVNAVINQCRTDNLIQLDQRRRFKSLHERPY